MNLLSSQYIANIINQKMSLPVGRVFLRDQSPELPQDTHLYIAVGIVNAFPMSAETSMRPATAEDWDQANQVWDVDGQTYDISGFTNYDRGGENWDTPNQTFDQLPPTQIEVNELVQQEWVQVDVCSKNMDAMIRNWEVIAAMNSFYSQSVQETNNFKIFRLPRGPINTSSAEGGSYLNRYTLTVPCFAWYRKETVMMAGDYYDDFHTQVDDAHTLTSEPQKYDVPGETWDSTGQNFDAPQPLIEFEIDQEGIQP